MVGHKGSNKKLQFHWQVFLLFIVQGKQFYLDGPDNRSGNLISNYEPPKRHLTRKDGTQVRTEEKSVELLMELLDRFSEELDVVFDPFAGTASLALAAVQLNRKFSGCEKDTMCHSLASTRLFEFFKKQFNESNYYN